MPAVPIKNSTDLVQLCLFLLPRAKRIAIYRWKRGRKQFKKLSRADYVIVSCPKAGRTWLRVMISRFYSEKYQLTDAELLGFDNFHKLNPVIPRIFSTHDNYIQDFTGHRDDKRDFRGKKVLLLVRDPRDVVVSQFFQWKYRVRPVKKALLSSLKDSPDVGVFDFATHPDHGIPRNMRFLSGWRDGLRQLEDHLIVRYEDLRANTAVELERVLRFFDAECNHEQIEDAVSFAAFESMRAREQQRSGGTARHSLAATDRGNPDSYKTRRAKIGGFVDYFDEQQIATINRLLDPELLEFFGYSIEERDARVAASRVAGS
ncbi:MAG: sulfotransferase domain-containing protein [Gammaproteobacteria bacterium]